MMAVCPAESDYAADSERSVEAILIAIDPGQFALAAAEDSVDAQLIERLSSYDQALFDLRVVGVDRIFTEQTSSIGSRPQLVTAMTNRPRISYRPAEFL